MKKRIYHQLSFPIFLCLLLSTTTVPGSYANDKNTIISFNPNTSSMLNESGDYDKGKYALDLYKFEEKYLAENLEKVTKGVCDILSNGAIIPQENKFEIYSIFGKNASFTPDGNLIYLPLSLSYSPFPFNDGQLANCDPQGIHEKMKEAEKKKELLFFDSKHYASILTHEYAHYLFQLNIVDELYKIVPPTTEENQDFYKIVALMKKEGIDELIMHWQELLYNIKNSNDPSMKKSLEEELASVLKEIEKKKDLIKSIEQKSIHKENIWKFIGPYTEFFADFMAVLYQNDKRDVYTLLTDDGYQVPEKYKDKYGARSFSQKINPTKDEDLYQTEDPHLLIYKPRIYLEKFIDQAQDPEQKKILAAKVMKAMKDHLLEKVKNLKLGEDFFVDPYHGFMSPTDPVKMNIELTNAISNKM
ncbi:MAG: hypothetical protein HQK52_11425 [Oligoflexia bacterium]|nr:hypothetical protein [Oligoflexia bacterium]